MLCYVMLELLSCLLSWSRIEAMCSAFWSAESEALHSAEHCGPLKARLKPWQISNFSTFLLYLDYELLLRSLRSLRSKNSYL